MDTEAFCVVHKVLKALRHCVSGVGALLRFSCSYKSMLPTSLPLCLLISKGGCTSPQDSWQRYFAGTEKRVRSPQPLISSLVFSAFLSFQESLFSNPVLLPL